MFKALDKIIYTVEMSSRDAVDSTFAGSLFQSRNILREKELGYVASEILSWKYLAGPLTQLSLAPKHLSVDMSII